MSLCASCPERKKKRRSGPQHRRFMAMVRAAFHHWPEGHDRQFDDEEDCRKWLQMKAGHREVATRLSPDGMDIDLLAAFVAATIKKCGGYGEPVQYGGDVVVLVPKSIAFDQLDHLEACRVFDDVAAVIEAETGFSAERLMKETENAA